MIVDVKWINGVLYKREENGPYVKVGGEPPASVAKPVPPPGPQVQTNT